VRQIGLYVVILFIISGCSRHSVLQVQADPREVSLSEHVTLKMVTFNIQDTYIVGTNRQERMEAIAGKLCELDPDIVGFQESFIASDRKVLIDSLSSGSRLQYHQYYPSPVAGSGLLISSAYEIVDKSFHRFAASNPFYKVWEADWWGGKGVAMAKIKLPLDTGFLKVYNTHTQADYDNSDYEAIRSNQFTNLVKFVRETKGSHSPAILIGDINCLDGDVEYQSLVNNGNLLRLMDMESGLDHIFAIQDGLNLFDIVNTTEIQEELVVDAEITSLSDHPGYMTTLSITPTNKYIKKERENAQLILD